MMWKEAVFCLRLCKSCPERMTFTPPGPMSGTQRSSSSAQTRRTELGATMSTGQSSRKAQQVAIAWIVFPRPMSSPISARPPRRTAKATPALWNGSKARSNAAGNGEGDAIGPGFGVGRKPLLSHGGSCWFATDDLLRDFVDCVCAFFPELWRSSGARFRSQPSATWDFSTASCGDWGSATPALHGRLRGRCSFAGVSFCGVIAEPGGESTASSSMPGRSSS
mmetsp:Transcript_74298/g.215320  ORF Transcript_74298/g.215320 Transcript_74298/m.215320 type:complete len:222 (+) Transcript_74298:1446-2111(+)